MALTPGTDTYNTVEELDDYALARSTTLALDQELTLIKAMDYIESRNFSGSKTDETQDLEFPRNGNLYVPTNIKKVQLVIAVLIDGGVDMFATIERAIKSDKTGPLETVWQDNASEYVRYPEVEVLLRPFISSGIVVSND
jgi:hypothetical protein